MFVDIFVRHSDHLPTPRAHVSITPSIIGSLKIGAVRAAIHFDDDARKRTGDVRDVWANRMLTAKTIQRPCARADARLENEFCARHALAQVASALLGFPVAAHDRPLRPFGPPPP